LAMATCARVAALKNVLLPTLGFPTTPTEKPTVHHILPYKCTELLIDVFAADRADARDTE